MAADREWFAAHPGADYYRRQVTLAERFEIRTLHGAPLDAPVTGRVLVRRVTPGVSARGFGGVIVHVPGCTVARGAA